MAEKCFFESVIVDQRAAAGGCRSRVSSFSVLLFLKKVDLMLGVLKK